MERKKLFRRIWTTAAVSLLICILTGTVSIYAGEWEEKNASAAAGYYHSEEESVVLLGNGTMFVISSSDGEMQVFQFTVQSDGTDMIISSGDKKYALVKQKDKGKTESGGTYYAFYSEYAGNASDVSFTEGKQIQFGDEIFSHDYQVMVREPLSVFFGSDSDQAYTGDTRTEGDGFDTPDEAVSAYIEGLCNGDIQQMLSACAVESFVEGYDLEAFVERTGSLQPVTPGSYLPVAGDLSEGINLGTRKTVLNTLIKYQYLTLCGSKMVIGDDALKTLPAEDISAGDLIREYLPDREPDITFSGEIIPPVLFLDKYYYFFNQKGIANQNAYKGAEQSVDRAAVVYVDGKIALVILGVSRYNGRWFVTETSNLALFLGLSTISGGVIPLYLDEEYQLLEQELIAYLNDPSLQLVIDAATQELESIDMNKILSLDVEEQEAAYEQEVAHALSKLSSQNQEFIEQLLNP